MGRYTADAVLQRHGCGALLELAFGDVAFAQAVVEGGGVAVVVAAMRRYTADADVQHSGCGALRNLAFADAVCAQAVVDGVGVAAVVTAMRQHTVDAELQRLGCGALCNLAFGDAARGQAIVDAGSVAAVVAAMGQHTAYAELQRYGCGALRNLAFGDTACKQTVLSGGGVAAVVAAMGRHTEDAMVQLDGCGALQNLAKGDAACKRAVMGAGGINALVRAGRAFPQVHANVTEAIRLLLGDLGGFGPAPTTPASPPPQPQPPAGPSPDVAALAEAQRAKQRAEQRAKQEREQRAEAERRAEQEAEQRAMAEQDSLARCTRIQLERNDLQTQLQQCQAQLQELQELQRERNALREAAIDQAVHAKDAATQQQLSASAAPLVRWISSYQPTRQCPSFATIWSADRPTEMGPFSIEVGQLLQRWSEGGLGRRPTRDTLTRIESISLPKQDREAFFTWVEQKEAQRFTGQPCFNPRYPNGDATGEKAAVLERLKGRFLTLDCLQKQNVLLAFHGCSHENADSICKDGFAVVPYRDKPWFGKGLYCTTCAAAHCTSRLPPLPCLTSCGLLR